jgi:hypothetical protein
MYCPSLAVAGRVPLQARASICVNRSRRNKYGRTSNLKPHSSLPYADFDYGNELRHKEEVRLATAAPSDPIPGAENLCTSACSQLGLHHVDIPQPMVPNLRDAVAEYRVGRVLLGRPYQAICCAADGCDGPVIESHLHWRTAKS